MPLYHAQIYWTSDPGNSVIVGIFDDLDKSVNETIAYFETVQGPATVYRQPDWKHPLYNTMVVAMTFIRDRSDVEHGSAVIYEVPVNQTFPGSIRAVSEA